MSELNQNMDTPSIRLRQPGLLVYLCGIATSILTILAVHWCNRNGTYIMGWFVNGFLPGGAILVGVSSGLGYAIGSRMLHVKLSKLFLAVMFATGIIDYFVSPIQASSIWPACRPRLIPLSTTCAMEQKK